MNFEYPPGATPLDPDEAAGLIPGHITTQGELNAWEQTNILEAEQWAFRQKTPPLLTEGFVRDLHRKMFDSTWHWAGTFRSSNKNIGVDWTQLAVQLRNLLDNTQYQLDHEVFPVDELAVRFHHQLVFIHPFPNGNGRHARLMADLLVVQLGKERFSWGSKVSLTGQSEVRKRYIEALRAADQQDISLLLNFARS